ncbi:hypothetical protein JFQ93_004008 [Aeromonas sobria]|nr:hypothetical protein [Aeromonas sobria]
MERYEGISTFYLGQEALDVVSRKFAQFDLDNSLSKGVPVVAIVGLVAAGISLIPTIAAYFETETGNRKTFSILLKNRTDYLILIRGINPLGGPIYSPGFEPLIKPQSNGEIIFSASDGINTSNLKFKISLCIFNVRADGNTQEFFPFEIEFTLPPSGVMTQMYKVDGINAPIITTRLVSSYPMAVSYEQVAPSEMNFTLFTHAVTAHYNNQEINLIFI